jgi:peptidyl-prolyl cis-trans isomerase C
MRWLTSALIVPFIVAAIAAGCGGNGEEKKGVEMRDDLAVSIDGTVITYREVDQELAMLKQQMAARASEEQLAEMEPMLRKQAVRNLVNRTLLNLAASREGIVTTPEQIEVRFEDIRSKFPTQEAFESQLETSNMTVDEFRSEIEKGILLEALYEMKTANLERPSDEEIREFYDTNIDRFSKPQRIRASHILIKADESDADTDRERKRVEIEGLRERLLAGEDIETLAADHSDCPSKSNGGDLGYFSRGQMVEPFENAAFSLEIGGISEVVETRFGYHVIKLTEKEDAGVTPFEESREDITAYLFDMKKQEEISNILESLRESAEITYADSTLAAEVK